MMPTRSLRPAHTALARRALCGVLAAGVFLAAPGVIRAASAQDQAGRQPGPAGHTAAAAPAALSRPEASPPVPAVAAKILPHPTTSPALASPALPLDEEDRQTRLTLFTALNFMLPRLLVPHNPQQLCQWGMNALLARPQDHTPNGQPGATPFAGLHMRLQPGPPPSGNGAGPTTTRLILLQDDRLLLSAPLPTPEDVTGWSLLSLRFMMALRQSVPQFRATSDDTLLARFLNGMLARLDPYSRYTPPPQRPGAPALASPSGERIPGPSPASVGLTLRQPQSRFPLVTALNLASPLWDAGVTPGASLISLNGHSTRNTPLTTLQQRLTGEPGSTVRLGFRLREGQYLTRDFSRGPMMEESVFPDHAGPYAILRVTRFSSHTAEEVSQYLSALLPDPAAEEPARARTADLTSPPRPAPALPGLVLDLRGNHGGMLQQAVMTASLFLDHGIIATTEGRAPQANHVWSIQGGDLTNNTPLALLVDRETGSAAEILAAALADRQRAVVTGSSSFGKGMVQVSAIMPNGGRLSLTWAHVTTPQGWALQGLGVIPQLCTAPHGHFPLPAQLAALRAGHSLMAETLQAARRIRQNSPEETRLALRAVCPPSPPGKADLPAALALFASPRAYQTALAVPPAPPRPASGSPLSGPLSQQGTSPVPANAPDALHPASQPRSRPPP